MEESVAEHKGELLDHGAIAEAEAQEHDTEEALESAEAMGENEVAEDAEPTTEDAGEAPAEEGEGESAEATEEGAEVEVAEESGDVEVAEEEGDQTMEDEVKAIFGDSDEEDNEDQGDQDNVSAGEEDEEHIEESTRKLKRLVKQRSKKHTSDDEAPQGDDEEQDEEQTPKKKKKRLSKKKRNAIEEDEGGEGEGEKKKKRRKKKKEEGEGVEGGEGGEVVADDGNDEDEAPRRRKQEEFEEFDAAMARLKHKRVKKDLSAEEEAKLTETVNSFIIKMEAAAELDEEANRNKQPATNKVASLKVVVDNLQKTRFADAFVNQGGFSAIRKWLQPLPDKSLPSLNIREQLLALLDTLPFNKELLQNSEVGKVIMFLWKSPNENPKNKRICAKIIEKWSRPIFGLNTAYRERDRGEEEELDRPSRRSKVEEDENEIDKRTREQMKDNRKFHARIPQRIFMDFKKQPVAEVKATPAAKNPHVAAAEADKRIKQKRRTKPTSSSGRVLRAERISVEGRMVK